MKYTNVVMFLQILQIFTFSLMAFVLSVFPLSQGNAFPLDMKKLRPLPGIETVDYQTFYQNSFLVEEKPLDDPLLAFQVRLPNGWKKSLDGGSLDIDHSNRVFGEVVSYISPPMLDVHSRFVLEVQELDHKISARDWFVKYVIDNGYSLEALNVIDNKTIEALYVVFRQYDSYVKRTYLTINGSKIVSASYEIPYDRWKTRRDLQTHSVNSFRLLNPSEKPIEQIKTYSFLELVKFDYLGSWTLLDNKIRSIDRMQTSLVTTYEYQREKDEKKWRTRYFSPRLSGRIDVNVIAKDYNVSMPEEIKKLSAFLKEEGLELAELIETREDYTFDETVNFAVVEAYDTNNKSQTLVGYEFWVAPIETDSYYIVVTLLGPNRSARYYQWAVNAQAFAQVIQTMREPS